MSPLLLLGGTFSPVHLGHLRMAEIASESLGVSATFLINSMPPHKEAPSVTSADRLRMLEIALQGTGFSIDTRELRRSSPSYTSETLREIRAERPHDPVIFIIGMDSFRTIGSWHEAEELPKLAGFFVIRRPGTEMPPLDESFLALHAERAENAEELLEAPAGRYFISERECLPVSSTMIREALSRGEEPELIAPGVLQYIREKGLYRR